MISAPRNNPIINMLRLYSRHCLWLLVFTALSQFSQAAIPLLSSPFPFEINVEGEELSANLKSALKKQRSESREFKLFQSFDSAKRFDKEILAKLLKAEGYYSAEIQTKQSENKLLYNIDKGQVYTVASIDFQVPEHVNNLPSITIPIKEGDALRAEKLLASMRTLKEEIQAQYCLFDINLSYQAAINKNYYTAYITFTLEESPEVNFGRPQLIGNTSIETSYLRNLITFEKGECFSRKQIELSRIKLLQSNLIAVADINIAKPENGEVLVTFDLTERKHRTLKAGIGYESNEGPMLISGWQHRNFLHRGQILDIESQWGEFKQNVTGSFKVPHFLDREQTLLLNSELLNEQRESYHSKFSEVGISLNKKLRKYFSGDIGSKLEYSVVSEPVSIEQNQNNENPDFVPTQDRSENYLLLSLPVGLNYNHTNALLNPRKGWSVSLNTQPFVDLENTNRLFTKTTFSTSVYLSASEWFWKPVLAMRAATGSISGISLSEVPAHHRYYVGGGGSVRGYAYQDIGDLNIIDGEDISASGGLSFSEISVEARFELNKSWGFVIFYDGGYAYSKERQPEFGKDFLYGAGLGIRYFTSFAPIRFDVATPLDQRCIKNGKITPCSTSDAETYDDSVQIYISIGQAF